MRLVRWREVVVEPAETGEDALALLRHYEYDVVVLKLNLPALKAAP